MPAPAVMMPDSEPVHERIIEWYHSFQRDLPWRREDCSPWGVFVSEVMLQQTPVARVLPRWEEWLHRWPTPADCAAAPTAEILTVWDRLGYPRRALRLQQAAQAMVTEHGGEVPATSDQLRALPGVGEYTAAAVACFAYQQPEVVVDTNVRRVLVRVFTGAPTAGKTYTAAQRRLAHDVFPDPELDDGGLACTWNIAAMELGSLVCTAKSPACDRCPVREMCTWVASGSPAPSQDERPRGQPWHGTDRQVRGAIMAALREAAATQRPVDEHTLLEALPLPHASTEQRRRCLESLLADGLAERQGQSIALPGIF
ncbi:A/G-specific adenine glycosylase [Nesterenkonia alba]|uniref:A/G-specific adenine glycosylase n=1 Tax=Nesterenkonia alba TaxID=515814 RepID=UPI0003B4396C|nr:A/G-specific adenine glycosylase [Nesterenkonia alba]